LNIVLRPHHAGEGQSADIAILRTMGATRGAIMRIFLITGASIGVVGHAGGLFARPDDQPERGDDPRLPVADDEYRHVFRRSSIS
jgi:hypothetical protein